MNPPRSRAEIRGRALRALAGGAVVVFAPKCLLCAWAYFGLGAALGIGLGGRELCGVTITTAAPWGAGAGLAALGIALAAAFALSLARRRRLRRRMS